MSKLKAIYNIVSYGRYKHWDESSKALPKIAEFSTDIVAQENVEFGFILNVKKAKGKKLTFCIYHPDIPDKNGITMAPFSGDVYVGNNNWDFYLGDCIWLPVENKTGLWRMTISDNNTVVAEKTFNVYLPDESSEASFWKKRGY